ncbi:winged helix-turn-helix domain-containing protein [Nonomuraea turcica]|uniref:winged helix-turn-helix domain-containing protein n=1 Tax=Nonomuraea sp. G32 TaxID=3067274 RepID=UPI00273C8A95|nr:winged helix-turn-helix domain-containing protein [Nonomuraea sp. G32]MDP4502892.1 winged helix-turn-helix domain-containing protein [Nonomuraea sp. G32]
MSIEVTPQDLVASRFAISPLIETMHAQWVLAGRAEAGVHGQWARRWREKYRELARDHPALRAAGAISGNTGAANVDFVAPPPTAVDVPFEAELASMRATPLEQAHGEITRVLAGRPVPGWVLDLLLGPHVVERLADAYEALWTEIVSHEWPRFRAILQRDVAQRAGRLAAYGWQSALEDLSPRVHWRRGGRIELEMRSISGPRRLGGKGLLFLPSAFMRTIAVYLEDAWPYAMIYPARGIAAAPAAPDADLSSLIGRSRALILAELAEPATTTQLAALLRQSVGTTGEHVAALRRTGLITGTRTGRSVLYARTPLGDALIKGARPSRAE